MRRSAWRDTEGLDGSGRTEEMAERIMEETAEEIVEGFAEQIGEQSGEKTEEKTDAWKEASNSISAYGGLVNPSLPPVIAFKQGIQQFAAPWGLDPGRTGPARVNNDTRRPHRRGRGAALIL